LKNLYFRSCQKELPDLVSLNKREELFSIITSRLEYKIRIVTNTEIDHTILNTSSNLNWLEADHSIEIIKESNANKAILDCPSTNIEKYKSYIQAKLQNIDLIVEHKADDKYLIVGAASIIAKVTRDRLIEEIKKNIGIDFGSGYPSDPKTIEFLRKYYNKYNIFRKSWSSYIKASQKSKQSNLDSF